MCKDFKTIILCTLTFLLGSTLWAQKPQTKSIVHSHYEKNSDNDLVLASESKTEYNVFNKIALQETYKADNSNVLQLHHQKRYSYDPKGRHQNTLDYDGNGILQGETKLYWDEYNNKSKSEHIRYNNGQQTSVVVTYLLEYDDEGNKQNEKFYDNNGNQYQERIWYYNSQKEIYKSFTWIDTKKEPRKEIYTSYKRNKNGDIIQSITNEKINGKEFRKDVRYFSNNYVIEWKVFLEGKLESHFINEYRDSVIIRTTRKNKRKILSIEDAAKQKERLERKKGKSSNNNNNSSDNHIFVTNTEYDAYGNILVSTQSIDDKVILVTQYSYDDYGNKTKTLKVDKEHNSKEEELLSYDDFGNIIQKTIKKNDKVVSEDKFKYTYFSKY